VLLAFGRLIFFTDFEIIASVVGDYGGGTVNMAPFTDSGLFAPDMAFRRRLDDLQPDPVGARGPRRDPDRHRRRRLRDPQDQRRPDLLERQYRVRQAVEARRARCGRSRPTLDDLRPARRPQAARGRLQPRQRPLRRAQHQRLAAPHPQGRRGQLAFQGEPEELLWAVRGDGQLALHPHVPEQEVRGFARLSHAAGAVLSACVIPSERRHRTTSCGRWSSATATATSSVELQAPPWEEGETALADAFYVDSGATYSGAPTTTVSGLDHLAGRRSRSSPTARWSPGAASTAAAI
jgi:hypothetical protein